MSLQSLSPTTPETWRGPALLRVKAALQVLCPPKPGSWPPGRGARSGYLLCRCGKRLLGVAADGMAQGPLQGAVLAVERWGGTRRSQEWGQASDPGPCTHSIPRPCSPRVSSGAAATSSCGWSPSVAARVPARVPSRGSPHLSRLPPALLPERALPLLQSSPHVPQPLHGARQSPATGRLPPPANGDAQ